MLYNKILVPVDGSELGECILPHLKAIAKGCSVPEIIILRVIEPLSAQTLSTLAQAGADLITRLERDIQTEAEKYVNQIVNNIKDDSINAIPAVIDGNASEEILKYTAANNIDLILMSTHGRTGLARFFMGSVAYKVLNHSTVPVLVIPPPGCRK